MKKLLALLALSSTCYAGWNIHYWTAEDVYKYLPRRIDLIGKTWWMKQQAGPDTSNIDEIGEVPCYIVFYVHPINPHHPPYDDYGWTKFWITTDLVNDPWVYLGSYRTHMPHDYELIVPLWEFVELPDTLFVKIKNAEVLRWSIYDGKMEKIIYEKIN